MSARKGFSLIEIMVAMTVLSIVLLSLAKISTAIGIRVRGSDIAAKRNAVLQLESNKAGAAPYSVLSARASDTTITRPFSYRRKVTITAAGPTRYTIKIVVIPTAAPTKADSITLDRVLPPGASPLCKGC